VVVAAAPFDGVHGHQRARQARSLLLRTVQDPRAGGQCRLQAAVAGGRMTPRCLSCRRPQAVHRRATQYARGIASYATWSRLSPVGVRQTEQGRQRPRRVVGALGGPPSGRGELDQR
jgi:hypothetical protein